MPNTKVTRKFLSMTSKFRQRGDISPNLVTLGDDILEMRSADDKWRCRKEVYQMDQLDLHTQIGIVWSL